LYKNNTEFQNLVASFFPFYFRNFFLYFVQTLDSFVSFDGLYKFNDEKMFKQFMQVNNQYELLFNFKNDIVKKKNELIKFLEKIFFKKVNDILLTEEEEVEYVNFLKNSFETDFKFLYTKIPFIYESKFYPFKNNSEYYKKLYNFYNEYVKPIEDSFFDKKSGYFKVEQRSKYDIYKKRSVSFLKNFLIVNQNDKDIGKNRMEYNYLLCYFKNTTRFKEALNFFKNIFYNYKLDLLYDHFFLGVSMLDLLRNFNFEMYLNIIEFKNLDEFYFTDFFVSKKFIENMKKMNVQNKIDNIHYQSDVL
jgi:hypothetical protein